MTGGIKPVDIIVPCLNNLQYTRKCYESLKKNTQIPFKLTFVDNGSRLPTQNYLKNLIKEDKRVKVIRNSQNLGAPAAFNQGIFATNEEKIILLNNDTILTAGWALKLLKALESQSKVGIAAPVLNPPSSKTMTLKEIDRMAAVVELKNRGSIREVPGVTSTCMALKREVVDKIGGFDENYGIGTNDDHDFCLRAREAGYKIVCSEEVFIYHYWNKTLGKMGIKELDKRNREYFIKKFGDRALTYLAETGQLRTLSKDSSD